MLAAMLMPPAFSIATVAIALAAASSIPLPIICFTIKEWMAEYICCWITLLIGFVNSEPNFTGPFVFNHTWEKNAPWVRCQKPKKG